MALAILTASCATNRKQASAVIFSANQAEKAANQKPSAAGYPDSQPVAKTKQPVDA